MQVFPRHPSAPDTYYINGAWAPAAITAVDKRFTDAELAAEYHSARADYEEASNHPSGTYWTPLDVVDEDNTAETALKRSTTFLHFLLRPHHDESPA